MKLDQIPKTLRPHEVKAFYQVLKIYYDFYLDSRKEVTKMLLLLYCVLIPLIQKNTELSDSTVWFFPSA